MLVCSFLAHVMRPRTPVTRVTRVGTRSSRAAPVWDGAAPVSRNEAGPLRESKIPSEGASQSQEQRRGCAGGRGGFFPTGGPHNVST